MNKILYKVLDDWIDPSQVLTCFDGSSLLCGLHSTLPSESDNKIKDLGRYSFISANPFAVFNALNGDVFFNHKKINKQPYDLNPFDVLNKFMQDYKIETNKDLPPFQGGAMGYFSYEIGSYLENIPLNQTLSDYDDMVIGIYDWVVSFDHKEKKVFITACGFNKDANKTIDFIYNKIKKVTNFDLVQPKKSSQVITDFTKKEYEKSVSKVIDYIYDGDIFQANMTQPFKVNYNDASPLQVYQYLSHINPAPFSAYIDCDNFVIASSSPERFIEVNCARIVETRPIKGTAPRSDNLVKDKKFSDDLLKSEKDRAENIMIVDLMRNDLSRVCKAGSISVPKVCGLESYQSVHHLVSIVKGELQEDKNAFDLLKNCFPGGSITGAPKIRSQEIIAELESCNRGVYCGCIGYIGFDGVMDTNIAIRTMTLKDNVASFNAGGGIVSDSKPESEYDETMIKADKMIKVFK